MNVYECVYVYLVFFFLVFFSAWLDLLQIYVILNNIQYLEQMVNSCWPLRSLFPQYATKFACI